MVSFGLDEETSVPQLAISQTNAIQWNIRTHGLNWNLKQNFLGHANPHIQELGRKCLITDSWDEYLVRVYFLDILYGKIVTN